MTEQTVLIACGQPFQTCAECGSKGSIWITPRNIRRCRVCGTYGTGVALAPSPEQIVERGLALRDLKARGLVLIVEDEA